MDDTKTYMKNWSEYYDMGVRDAVKKVQCANNFSNDPDGAMCGYLNGYFTIIERDSNRAKALHFIERHLREMKGIPNG